jgi:CheY-like chemotaxis protein
MRIVVAKTDVVCELAIGVLRDRGHTIDVLPHDGAITAIRGRSPEVILVWIPESDGVALVRELAAADVAKTAFVVGVLPSGAPDRSISSALAAGCHDVVRAPCSNEELVARVEVLERLRGWQGVQQTTAVAKPRVDTARAWAFLGDVVADDLEMMVGRPLRVARGGVAPTAVRSASIPMVFARDHLELAISLAADEPTCRWLGENLLGDATLGPEALDDVLREMANVAGGAMKRAMLPEGVVLSIGIPVGGDARAAQALGRTPSARRWRICLDDGISLLLVAEERVRPNQRVPARRLIEGMVLVADVHNAAGVLLLPGGTRLTSTTADKLARLLDTNVVEVSLAA